jgi:hypothetical protein
MIKSRLRKLVTSKKTFSSFHHMLKIKIMENGASISVCGVEGQGTLKFIDWGIHFMKCICGLFKKYYPLLKDPSHQCPVECENYHGPIPPLSK